jgi:Fic family protein
LPKLENIMGLIEPPPPTQNLFDFLFKDNVLIQQHLSQTNDWAAVVKGINDEYLYWDKVKYKVSADLKEKISPELLWQLTKNARLASKKNLSFADHSFYLTQTDILFEHLHQFDLHLGGSLGGREIISDQDQNRYLIGSIMEESIASSQIEGAVTSRLVAKEMLRKNRTPRNTSERMIFNNYQTIRHITKTKDQPLTADSLLEIHRLMTDGV